LLRINSDRLSQERLFLLKRDKEYVNILMSQERDSAMSKPNDVTTQQSLQVKAYVRRAICDLQYPIENMTDLINQIKYRSYTILNDRVTILDNVIVIQSRTKRTTIPTKDILPASCFPLTSPDDFWDKWKAAKPRMPPSFYFRPGERT
jgi:hypothetical protein